MCPQTDWCDWGVSVVSGVAGVLFCCDSCRCLFSSWQMHTVSSPAAVRLLFDMCPLYRLAVLTGSVWTKLTVVEGGHVLQTDWQALAKLSSFLFLFGWLFWVAPLVYLVCSWHSCFSCYLLLYYLLFFSKNLLLSNFNPARCFALTFSHHCFILWQMHHSTLKLFYVVLYECVVDLFVN